MANPGINFIDPSLVNKVINLGDGTRDLIIGHRGSSEQLHIHDHPKGQTLTLYEQGNPIARGTIPSPGKLIDFGK